VLDHKSSESGVELSQVVEVDVESLSLCVNYVPDVLGDLLVVEVILNHLLELHLLNI